jgi:hypothetical protein
MNYTEENKERVNEEPYFPPRLINCKVCKLPHIVFNWNPKVPFLCEECTLTNNAGSVV